MRKIIGLFLALLLLPMTSGLANAGTIIAKVNLTTQTMVVTENGWPRYKWKVSTARKGYVTPLGTYRALWLAAMHRSKKYHNSPMPYSVFFNGGYAVHGTYEVRRLGQPASHGCIRLHPDNAAIFFNLVSQAGLSNTKIIVTQ
jgi:lipoprotein-anchoring transpeptidase ErfK/SrfK